MLTISFLLTGLATVSIIATFMFWLDQEKTSKKKMSFLLYYSNIA